LLLVAGYKEDEIARMDLNKVTDDELQRTIRQKLLGMMAGNGSRQRVVPVGQVETKLAEGWEFVSTLPDDKAILKLPSG
jgi:site-specific recombinase XerC